MQSLIDAISKDDYLDNGCFRLVRDFCMDAGKFSTQFKKVYRKNRSTSQLKIALDLLVRYCVRIDLFSALLSEFAKLKTEENGKTTELTEISKNSKSNKKNDFMELMDSFLKEQDKLDRYRNSIKNALNSVLSFVALEEIAKRNATSNKDDLSNKSLKTVLEENKRKAGESFLRSYDLLMLSTFLSYFPEEFSDEWEGTEGFITILNPRVNPYRNSWLTDELDPSVAEMVTLN